MYRSPLELEVDQGSIVMLIEGLDFEYIFFNFIILDKVALEGGI